MKSPASCRTFVILAIAVWLLMPVAEAAADSLYLMLPHDPNADSPEVAIMQLTGFAIMLAVISPVFALFVWFVCRRYIGAQPLFSFGRTRPLLSSALWLVFGALALLFLTSVFFVRHIADVPWAAHGVLAAYFLLSCNTSLLAAYASHTKGLTRRCSPTPPGVIFSRLDRSTLFVLVTPALGGVAELESR